MIKLKRFRSACYVCEGKGAFVLSGELPLLVQCFCTADPGEISNEERAQILSKEFEGVLEGPFEAWEIVNYIE